MKITWYGHSAFRLDFAGKAILIDPFFTGNPGFEGQRAEIIAGVCCGFATRGSPRSRRKVLIFSVRQPYPDLVTEPAFAGF